MMSSTLSLYDLPEWEMKFVITSSCIPALRSFSISCKSGERTYGIAEGAPVVELTGGASGVVGDGVIGEFVGVKTVGGGRALRSPACINSAIARV